MIRVILLYTSDCSNRTSPALYSISLSVAIGFYISSFVLLFGEPLHRFEGGFMGAKGGETEVAFAF